MVSLFSGSVLATEEKAAKVILSRVISGPPMIALVRVEGR
jgi:hypothetical protein